MHLNPVDAAVLAIFLLAIVDGARRGFTPYATELSALVIGLGVAFAAFEPAGREVHRLAGVSPGLAGFGAFLIILVAAHAAVQAPVQRFAMRLAATVLPRLAPPAHAAAGAAPALGTGVLLVALVLSAVVVMPGPPRSLVLASTIGSTIADRSSFMQPPLRLLLVPASGESHRILDPSTPANDPGEDAFYRLQFPADLSVELDVPAEEQMLKRVNDARARAGLSRLRMDPLLQEVAREHSRDMYARHYFSHATPDHRSPYDRMRDHRLHYVTAGENIAFAPDPDQAWSSLMQSADHRANILNPDFRCIGIGAYRGLNGYEEMFTQDFADCTG